jgi:hypothetical protein
MRAHIMGPLHEAVATLRVSRTDLDPDDVSRLLGMQPTYSQREARDPVSSAAVPPQAIRRGLWRLKAQATETADIDHQVSALLSQLTQDLSVWGCLAANYKIDLFCGWFMKEGNEGVEISPTSLSRLGERHVMLALDMYGPSDRIREDGQ